MFKNGYNSIATRAALYYFAAGVIWIITSDVLLELLTRNFIELSRLQTVKGSFFVLISSILVFAIVKTLVAKSTRAEQGLLQSEHALEENRRTMAILLENMPGMAYRSSDAVDRQFQFASAGSLELTGYTPDQLMQGGSVCFGEIIHSEDKIKVAESIATAAREGTPFKAEYRITTKNGETRWLWGQGRSIGVHTDGGHVIEGFVTDVTSRVEAEVEARKSESLRKIGQAAAAIVHDLKNQIQVIQTSIDLMQYPDSTPMELAEYCEMIQSRINAMLSLSQDILDYSRDNTTIAKTEVDVAVLCKGVAASLSLMFSRAGVSLNCAYPESQTSDLHVAGDSNKLERAITNLLTNSMQACARGGSVTLRVKHHNGKVQIEVQDDGPGVAPEIRESLFEPFVSEGKPDGTGLGLAIVRSIVTAHGGVVSLIPSESGALFRIALPECSGSSAIDSGEYAPVKVALPASSASD